MNTFLLTSLSFILYYVWIPCPLLNSHKGTFLIPLPLLAPTSTNSYPGVRSNNSFSIHLSLVDSPVSVYLSTGFSSDSFLTTPTGSFTSYSTRKLRKIFGFPWGPFISTSLHLNEISEEEGACFYLGKSNTVCLDLGFPGFFCIVVLPLIFSISPFWLIGSFSSAGKDAQISFTFKESNFLISFYCLSLC